MNEDHAEAVRLYAVRLLGRPDGDWRFAGLDPEGCDLLSGGDLARLDFPERVRSPGVLRQVLKTLAEEARAR
jgi:putative heme iron utilization protein